MRNMYNLLMLFYIFSACYSVSTKGQTDQNSDFNITKEVYKSVCGKNLSLEIFTSRKIIINNIYPAIIFFHGGGWNKVGENRFYSQCRYFAAKGFKAITVEYRLCNDGKTTPVECIMDVKSAVRWVKENADRLKINKNKIAVSGASAGGHLAACTAILKDINETSDNLDISPVPNALILYYPCVNTAEDPWFIQLLQNKLPVEKTSPYHNIQANLPPTIIFHGTTDDYVPYWTVVNFNEKMHEFGNSCELFTYTGKSHFLFNTDYDELMQKTNDFLTAMGFYETKNIKKINFKQREKPAIGLAVAF